MFTFFAAFSRFEYALKVAGFTKAETKGAEADWDRFAIEIAVSFDQRITSDAVLKAAVEELVTEPPKKQRNNLTWTDVEHQGDADGAANVLLLVRRIRNNFFHGGKAQRQGVDGDRDNRLAKDALLVLDRALECHDGVWERFVEV
jgi:hypothetical protein